MAFEQVGPYFQHLAEFALGFGKLVLHDQGLDPGELLRRVRRLAGQDDSLEDAHHRRSDPGMEQKTGDNGDRSGRSHHEHPAGADGDCRQGHERQPAEQTHFLQQIHLIQRLTTLVITRKLTWFTNESEWFPPLQQPVFVFRVGLKVHAHGVQRA